MRARSSPAEGWTTTHWNASRKPLGRPLRPSTICAAARAIGPGSPVSWHAVRPRSLFVAPRSGHEAPRIHDDQWRCCGVPLRARRGAARRAARRTGPHRHQGGLRKWRLWRLQHPARRSARLCLPRSRGGGGGGPNRDHRGTGPRRRAAPATAPLPRGRGAAVRRLHTGLPGGGEGPARSQPGPDRGGDPLLAGGQPLPAARATTRSSARSSMRQPR